MLIFYDLKNVNKYTDFSIKTNKSSVIKIFKSGFYTFAIAFLGIYIINAPKYAIDVYLTENYQTIFGIIVMPATIVGLVAQFLIHPFLNQILKLYENGKLKELRKLSIKLVLAIALFGLISSGLAYFVGTQVLGCIYGLDLSIYKVGLLVILIASTLYTIGTIYSSILTSIRETFSQFIIYIVVAVVALFVSQYATKIGKMDGAIVAYLLIMSLQFFIYTIYANIKICRKGVDKCQK